MNGSYYRLQHYEEAAGIFSDLKVEDGSIVARIGRIDVIFPEFVKEILEFHIGKRIAILRTDVKDKPYLIRVMPLDLDSVDQKTAQSTSSCEVL